MIILKLAEALGKRRLSIVELSDRTGIPARDLEILRDNKAMALRLTTLDALCRGLSCAPADLIEYLSETDESAAS